MPIAKLNHDLRTPLNSLIGASELMGMTPLNSRQRELLEVIATASKDLLSIVNTRMDQQALALPAAPSPSLPLRGHVLLVEDYLPNQKIARRMLEILGCTVDTARSGEEALERMAGGKYDAVLMDCQMPEMDGFQTTAAIRQREKDGHAIIIAITANTLSGDRERCLAAGMDDYISKPLRAAELRRVLSDYLALKNPEPHAAE